MPSMLLQFVWEEESKDAFHLMTQEMSNENRMTLVLTY